MCGQASVTVATAWVGWDSADRESSGVMRQFGIGNVILSSYHQNRILSNCSLDGANDFIVRDPYYIFKEIVDYALIQKLQNSIIYYCKYLCIYILQQFGKKQTIKKYKKVYIKCEAVTV